MPLTVYSAISNGLFESGLHVTDPDIVPPASTDSHYGDKKAFLDDVIAGDPSTAGGRLASWLTRVADQVRFVGRLPLRLLFCELIEPLVCVDLHRSV